MQIERLQTTERDEIEGPLLITPRVFCDDRGWFFESWNQNKFNEAAGEQVMFSQDNHSALLEGS